MLAYLRALFATSQQVRAMTQFLKPVYSLFRLPQQAGRNDVRLYTLTFPPACSRQAKAGPQ